MIHLKYTLYFKKNELKLKKDRICYVNEYLFDLLYHLEFEL